jgi:hypothetical protein
MNLASDFPASNSKKNSDIPVYPACGYIIDRSEDDLPVVRMGDPVAD